ncbi:MAG TPA: MFS transporter, partial [Vicinamibacteria bacterium]|nr:MFS transporter [Vicinamibacteria bacterium]
GLTAGALSASAVVQGVCSPLAGLLVDRLGPRPVALGGALVLGAASLLAATVTAPWQLYLYTGALGAVGLVGLGWVPMGVLLSRWFSERRGRAVGVAFSGMGVGILVIGPLAQWLITTVGWRQASATLGLGTLALLLPLLWLFVRDPPARPPGEAPGAGPGRSPAPPADPTLRHALATPAFWALFLAYFFTPLAVFPVATHQVAFAVDLGYAPLLAAAAFGTAGFMSTVGRVCFGLAADRFGGPLAATISFGCTAGGVLALLVLERVPWEGWLVIYALLFGLGFGARGPIITAMASERFGGRRFGVIYGVLNCGNGFGGAVGPWLGGVVHDVTGTYRAAFLASIVFCALGSACFWLTRRRAP